MLKITDENGKLKFVLSEEDSEPQPVKENKTEVKDEEESEGEENE